MSACRGVRRRPSGPQRNKSHRFIRWFHGSWCVNPTERKPLWGGGHLTVISSHSAGLPPYLSSG
jgi:hypothetical protein